MIAPDVDGWELSGEKCHPSLAAAGRVAIWLGTIERLAGWEFTATTLENGSHRVLRRRADGRPTGAGGPGRTAARTPRPHPERARSTAGR